MMIPPRLFSLLHLTQPTCSTIGRCDGNHGSNTVNLKLPPQQQQLASQLASQLDSQLASKQASNSTDGQKSLLLVVREGKLLGKAGLPCSSTGELCEEQKLCV